METQKTLQKFKRGIDDTADEVVNFTSVIIEKLQVAFCQNQQGHRIYHAMKVLCPCFIDDEKDN